jgi:hypothetical protein
MKRVIQYDHPVLPVKTDFADFVSFPEEIREGFDNEVPCYSELLSWNSSHPELSLSIVFPLYEDFSGIIPDSVNLSNLTDSISYSFTQEFMQKKPYLQIKILPFRINPENNKLQRLKSFVIRIEDKNPVEYSNSGTRKSLQSANSVLSEGKWYKIKVPSSGIYKLTYDQINSMSVGDPGNVRIFGSGGEVLPEDCRKGEKDDLLPVQLYFNKGNDGIFNSGDYVLFYSRGAVKWSYDSKPAMFRHLLNPYSDFSYYFVTSGAAPDLPEEYVVPAGIANKFSDSYDFRIWHEEEKINVLLSGKQWFGEDFSNNQIQSFTFAIPGLIVSAPLEILAQVMAKSTAESYFQMSYNNVNVDTFTIQAANLSDYTSTFGFTSEQKTIIYPASNSISLKMKYIKPDGLAKGWLDYIIINARASLQLQTDLLEFRDLNTVAAGKITQFTLNAASAGTVVWDVTNQNNILKMPGSLSGSQFTFKAASETLKEFVAFNVNGNFPAPVLQGNDLGPVANQNLHGPQQPDLVIISYPDFLPEAEQLASYRREKSGLDVLVVTPDKIYNEFSSGTPDISAYRNFLKMLYNRAGSDSTLLPRYLLLFGDGSYDNKNISGNATNYTLTYQSENSLNPTSSYVSDDFYGLLDPGETMTTGLLDMGIGRLPVTTKTDAEVMLKKILDYELPSSHGDWRNSVCFIGDDEDGNIHMSDADGLATYVSANYPGYNINKIYLDAYKQVSTPSGQRYPDVNQAINDQVARGALIINYTGHGGIKGWAHEIILDMNAIDSWKNNGRLPLFMTATCDFSRYDDHEITTAGEKVLLNPNGGGIALLTTTRLVYSQPNRVLNEKFYEIVFAKDKDGHGFRLGDIVQYTKNQAGNGINKRNFTLLGDPSQRLSYPEYYVKTDSLNGKAMSEVTDTLKALKKVTIRGHIADMGGNILTGFNGNVYPTVYDKAIIQQTMANDGGNKKNFSIRTNILYKGKSTVQNGVFNFTFMVPKDINYAYGSGRLSFYADDSVADASGSYNGITIGGTYSGAETDVEGPELKIFMNSSAFRPGGITDENPMLYVEVSDKNGVNTSGNGIGHDITAILDDKSQNVFLLNEYYQSYLNSYQGGLIRYPFSNLETGLHTVSVKVWDIYNNSTTGSTDFIVMKSEDLILEDLLNYPNPFSDYTNFSFSHNKPGTVLEITVDIFNMDGKLINTIKAKEAAEGYRSQNIYWDGSGAQNGQSIYIYRIRVQTSDGKTAEKSGKLIITR